MPRPGSIEETRQALEAHGYIAERSLATAIFLALRLERPLLLEGEPGVGKTAVAKVLAAMLGAELIRLQCYEGLDVSQAVYDWDYARQMLQIRLLEAAGEHDATRLRQEVFGPAFLRKRALLHALEPHGGRPPVLLIDEIDRADEEFEAFLLELLADWQITIPEVGTIRAEQPPVVVITSNRTREIHDALKRRCLYHWIPYPSFEKELQILTRRVPGLPDALSRQIVGFVQALRQQDLYKAPGVAETLDWAAALVAIDAQALTATEVEDTLGALVKYQDDVALARSRVQDILGALP
ncbi:MAG TPA: MoxR family ATPase [Vicinamibacterales bacterium]